MKLTIKNPNKEAKNYHSPLLDKLLAERNPAETARTEARMVLSVRIADALEAKGMSKKELATQLKQHPSAVTKWLSGQHNFTIDTLTDIGGALNIDLLGQDSKSVKNIMVIPVLQVVVNMPAKPNLPKQNVYNQLFLRQTETEYN